MNPLIFGFSCENFVVFFYEKKKNSNVSHQYWSVRIGKNCGHRLKNRYPRPGVHCFPIWQIRSHLVYSIYDLKCPSGNTYIFYLPSHYKLTQSVLLRTFPIAYKSLNISPPKISPSKRVFEKYKPRGLLSEFYGNRKKQPHLTLRFSLNFKHESM